MQIKGLNEFRRKLEDLQKRAENLNGTHSVPISELLTPSFMQQNTKFTTFDEMLAVSGFKAETQAEFDAIPDDEWNAFVVSVTQFSDWQAMLNEAGVVWVKKELDF